MLQRSVVETCLECCREVLEISVAEKCCRGVLEKSGVEKCWRRAV